MECSETLGWLAGTRIPVHAIKSFHDHGYSVSEIIGEYPDLTSEDVEAALNHDDFQGRLSPETGACRFFIDQCVPESVAGVLESHNQEVVRLREKIAPESPDPLVAAVAETNDAILVTMDGDFRKLASRHGVGNKRYKRLSLLRFEHCIEAKTASRVERPCPSSNMSGL